MPRPCLILALLLVSVHLAPAQEPPTSQPKTQERSGTVEVASINHPAISESSGIVLSRRHPGVLWTHNDSGNPAVLFAIDRGGRLIAEYQIAAENIDWEDIAVDDAGRLYIADIGNNAARRATLRILVLAEPDPADPTPQEPLRLERQLELRYPTGRRFDAEAFFIHDGRGYLIAKELSGRLAPMYSFPLDGEGHVRDLQPVAEVPVRIPVTAADVSADGKWLAVMTVAGPQVFRIDSDLSAVGEAASYSRVYVNPNIEAVTVVPEGVLATTESGKILLFTWKQLNVLEQ